mgnify:CR=1 FL=1
MSNQRLIAIDPSSTRIGWALFDGTLVDAGFTRPGRTKDGYIERVRSMVDDLCGIVERHEPNVAVIEVPSGKAARGSRPGMAGTQAIYGLAVGAVWQSMLLVVPSNARGGHGVVETTTEREWTRSVPKAARARTLPLEYPQLDWSADGGLDMADAIGIGLWWIGQQPLRAARAAGGQR